LDLLCCCRWTIGSVGKGCVTLIGDALHPMTPNLGQGGCTALEDAVVLARTLGGVLNTNSSSQQDIEACLRSYEAERSKRCLAITVRANAMGAALQISFEPVCSIRDLVIERNMDPSHFLDHTSYDCGTLQSA
jgi:2-polyprenyl-6-methoxyphenol hydroxylase-like FAD-dependent oxidoreductase